MHTALNNHDILALIFASLSPEVGSDRASVLNCGLACRAFKEHALDALWRSIYSIMPLLHVIPCINVINGKWALERPVKPNELEHFKYYAHRVQVLLDYQDSISEVDLSVFSQLTQLLGGPLLPRLRATHFVWVPGRQFPDVLIGPMLDFICIRLIRRSRPRPSPDEGRRVAEGFSSLLLKLSRDVPRLCHLIISDTGSYLPIAHDFCSLKRLKTLQVENLPGLRGAPKHGPVLTPNQFLSLSAFTELHHLKLNVAQASGFGDISFHLPYLHRVELIGPVSDVVATLRAVQTSPVVQVGLKLTRYDQVIYSLFPCVVFPHLEELAVSEEPSMALGISQPLEEPSAKTIISSLLSCLDLKKCSIRTPSVVVLADDGMMDSIAQSWPKLEEFAWDFHNLTDIGLTPNTLASFAAHCPRLISLGLPVQLEMPLPNERPISVHGLKHLTCYKALQPYHAAQAAQRILYLFPGLDRVLFDCARIRAEDAWLNEAIEALRGTKNIRGEQELSAAPARD
ncbi:hypothetical protein GLOTRDRAFT_140477 [Gloeophyllum trabeum ATCC 11539]|uniref:F-box domain-containing protein n=1 Tax=Gloeophyllum trabeum (strain ATCC 11539 / FP-39264 / Madison 617) TaxID=670483 RepID=S7PWZ3_GLOTA|nr:uncharacterized protein GLOTRDRAFT_140477 [Gloeophyllum trabeum ATCC 11539]EPQ51998.1 hypothetical protein GLOTRDRAFT_140477 [Gloeophyllum trabeum ATCC 11539]